MRNFEKIAVIGLGCAGLPLVVKISKRFSTMGYGQSRERGAAYRNFVNPSGPIGREGLRAGNIIVVTAAIPVDRVHQHDLTALICNSETVSKYFKKSSYLRDTIEATGHKLCRS